MPDARMSISSNACIIKRAADVENSSLTSIEQAAEFEFEFARETKRRYSQRERQARIRNRVEIMYRVFRKLASTERSAFSLYNNDEIWPESVMK